MKRLDLTEDERKARKREQSARNAARYRRMHPDRIVAYKQRPETKASEAARAERRRALWSPERKAEERVSYRRQHLNRLYGITPQEYDEMMEKQRGLCAVCGCEEPGDRWRSARLHVDHCHKTGKVRSLLCCACNQAIGLIKDNVSIARAMADYLHEHGHPYEPANDTDADVRSHPNVRVIQ